MEKRHEIEKLAYELWERGGRMPGRELEHWVEAERIVSARHAAPSGVNPAKAKSAAAPKTAIKKVAAKESKKMTPSKAAAESKQAKKSPAKGRTKKSATSQKETTL